jgi:hypothetical protein
MSSAVEKSKKEKIAFSNDDYKKAEETILQYFKRHPWPKYLQEALMLKLKEGESKMTKATLDPLIYKRINVYLNPENPSTSGLIHIFGFLLKQTNTFGFFYDAFVSKTFNTYRPKFVEVLTTLKSKAPPSDIWKKLVKDVVRVDVIFSTKDNRKPHFRFYKLALLDKDGNRVIQDLPPNDLLKLCFGTAIEGFDYFKTWKIKGGKKEEENVSEDIGLSEGDESSESSEVAPPKEKKKKEKKEKKKKKKGKKRKEIETPESDENPKKKSKKEKSKKGKKRKGEGPPDEGEKDPKKQKTQTKINNKYGARCGHCKEKIAMKTTYIASKIKGHDAKRFCKLSCSNDYWNKI